MYASEFLQLKPPPAFDFDWIHNEKLVIRNNSEGECKKNIAQLFVLEFSPWHIQ